MATIKLKNDKVVTKFVDNERRVSCSCCGCCLYGASSYLTGSFGSWYAAPPEVILDGNTLTLSLIYDENWGEEIPHYGNTTNGVLLELKDGGIVTWAVYRDGERTTQDCLFAGAVAENYADTYYLSFGGETIVLNRVSQCVWDSGILGELPCILDETPYEGGFGEGQYLRRFRLFYVPPDWNVEQIGGWEYSPTIPEPDVLFGEWNLQIEVGFIAWNELDEGQEYKYCYSNFNTIAGSGTGQPSGDYGGYPVTETP